jgi:hypothetical protein
MIIYEESLIKSNAHWKEYPVKNVHKKDERERVLENFETCLSREECAPQFSERIH